MNKLILTGALLAAGAFAFPDVSLGHGGTYRGPGDSVPPAGGGGGGGAGAGPISGPPGPAEPGSGPGTGGPGRVGIPGLAPGQGGNPTGGGDAAGDDLTVWQFWWGFNKDVYLKLKAALRAGCVLTGSDTFFIGRQETSTAQDWLRPKEETIRLEIVPALLRALQSERQNDIVSGCLVALAKIGDAQDEQGASPFQEVIQAFLADGNQEISETAAVALGILANEASQDMLVNLVMNTGPRSVAGTGQALVGSTEVPYRTRAFAAYGLGLIGNRAPSNETRREIAAILIEALETTTTSTRDLHVASIIALGLVPVDAGDRLVPAAGEELVRDAAFWASTRQNQVRYLLRYLENDRDNHYFVRAHAPRAMAKLFAPYGAQPLRDEALRAQVADALVELVGKHSGERTEVVQSAVLAMGQLADLDDDDVDARMRSALLEQVISTGDQQVKRFALISLAQLCAREGNGEGSQENYEAIAGDLTRKLGRSGGGTSQLKPWIGLALGVMQNARNEANLPPSTEVAQALRSALAGCRSPSDLGAYCIAVGIAKDMQAKALVIEKLAGSTDDEARGYAAVSLGLMGARDQIETIQGIVEESEYRHDLLKQAAVALGLLGDEKLVPGLITMLGDAKSLSTQAAISSALGFIGDSRSIAPLVEMLENPAITGSARGFAAVALGIVADKEDLPWNSKISTDINYRANTTTLTGLNGTGILDIL